MTEERHPEEHLEDISKLLKGLFLEYEYQSRTDRPREFTSSFDLLFSSSNSNLCSSPIASFSEHGNFVKKFDKTNIMRLKNHSIFYIPTKKTYTSVFACIADLSSAFNIEDLLKAFEWQDFEIFLCQSLESFGFSALHTFRYTINKKRHEVDIIGRDRHKILFIDAKHWNEKTASNSALYRVAQEQATRAEHLIQDPIISGSLLQRLGVSSKDTFQTYFIYPIILVSSNLALNTIINGIPIVPVLRFNEFLTNFSGVESMLKPIKMTKVVFQRKIK